MHFERFTVNRGLGGNGATAMIDGAQRLKPEGGLGDHAIGVSCIGGLEQVREEVRRQTGHVASHNQVPVHLGNSQRGENSPKRSKAGDAIRDHGITKPAVTLRGTDQSDASGGGQHARGDVFDHSRAVQRQQRLIPSHPGAEPTHQHKSGVGKGTLRVRCAHEMMITYVSRKQCSIVDPNKKVYICFLVAIAMLAASPYGFGMSPNDPGSDSSEHKTLVVRADPRTGRLVRNVVVRSGVPYKQPGRADFAGIVDKAARDHDVDPLLVESMIKVESNYNPNAISPKGAEGLLQLMPATARMLGVSNSFDPQQNIEAGVKYLSYLKSVYKDDRLALAAYNAGPGAVQKYKWIPPYRETQNYVDQVGKRYGDARRAAAAKAPAPPPPIVETAAAKVPEVVEEKHPKLEQFLDENGRLHLRTAQ